MSVHLEPKQIRKKIIEMAHKAQCGHIGPALSIVDIICQALGGEDKVILSKGHGAMAFYACLNEYGFVSNESMDAYLANGSDLHGLIEATMPGIEASSGSLGHGLSIAVGIALGLKRRGENRRVCCIVGDGEMNEGPCWEAALFAAHHELNNLTVIIDANGLQAMGQTADILALESLVSKFEAFNWFATRKDGHAPGILDINKPAWENLKPTAIIARTIKGKGISFMENDNKWHYERITDELYAKAMAELE